MGLAVVTVAAGGLPVVDVTSAAPLRGVPITEAANGRGVAVTKVAAGGMPVQYAYVGGDVPPVTGSAFTLNPSDVNGTVFTYSQGNMKAATVDPIQGYVRSTGGQTTGKFYFEATHTGPSFAAQQSGGIIKLSQALNTWIGTGQGGACYSVGTGAVNINFSNVANLAALTTGQTLCVAVDRTNSRIWFRVNNGNWNGNVANNPATNTGGYDISVSVGASAAYVACGLAGSSGNAVVVNFGATGFAYSVPSGFPGGPA